MSIGIYKITSPSGKIYIGKSENIEVRWRDYKHSKSQPRLIRSFKKYAIENHFFEIIEECEKEQLNKRERYWQEFYNVVGENGLNCYTESINTRRRTYTKLSKIKMSEGRKGENNHMYGKKLSQEQCKKISETHKGKIISEAQKNKWRISIGDKVKGGNNPRARKVICVLTSRVFDCITDCSVFLGVNRKTLNDQLIGRYP